jgi:hypothetical protein
VLDLQMQRIIAPDARGSYFPEAFVEVTNPKVAAVISDKESREPDTNRGNLHAPITKNAETMIQICKRE